MEPIIQAVEAWAKEYYGVDSAQAYLFPDEDEPERYIASLKLSGYDIWQAAEVWVENGQVVTVNDLGEGLAPEQPND